MKARTKYRASRELENRRHGLQVRASRVAPTDYLKRFNDED